MEEVRRNPQIILFIDEIHTIIGAGAAEGAVDAANIIAGAGTGRDAGHRRHDRDRVSAAHREGTQHWSGASSP